MEYDNRLLSTMRGNLSQYVGTTLKNKNPKTVTDLFLRQKVNEHCFEKCIPTPGTSLSKREEGCFTACMEKYMATWNVVSRQYISRIQKTQQGSASVAGGFGVPDI